MPKKKLIIPKFTSEAADAKWHQRHRRALESAMERLLVYLAKCNTWSTTASDWESSREKSSGQ